MSYYKPLSPGSINANYVSLNAGATSGIDAGKPIEFSLCIDGLNAFGLPEIDDVAAQTWRRSYTLFLGQRPWENENCLKDGNPPVGIHQASSLRASGSIRIDGDDVGIRHMTPVTPTVFQEQVNALILQMLRSELGSDDLRQKDYGRRPAFDAQVMLADWLAIDAVNDSMKTVLGANSESYRLAVRDFESQQRHIAREHRSLRPDVPVEVVLANAKVLRELAEQIQGYLQTHPGFQEKTTVVKRLDDKNGIHLFEVEVQSETPGDKIEFCFQKKGVFGKNQQLRTHIAFTEWQEDMPVGGHVLSDFKEETGEWVRQS